MPGGDDEDQRVLEDRGQRDVRVLHRPTDPEVDIAMEHQVEDFLGVSGADTDPHRRELRLEGLQQAGEQVGAHRRGGGDAQLARLARSQLGDGLTGLRGSADGALGERKQSPAGLAERHAAGCPHQEGDPDVALQGLETRRHGGLGEVELLRRPADVAGPGDLGEGLEELEQHRRTIHTVDGNHRKNRFALWQAVAHTGSR